VTRRRSPVVSPLGARPALRVAAEKDAGFNHPALADPLNAATPNADAGLEPASRTHGPSCLQPAGGRPGRLGRWRRDARHTLTHSLQHGRRRRAETLGQQLARKSIPSTARSAPPSASVATAGASGAPARCGSGSRRCPRRCRRRARSVRAPCARLVFEFPCRAGAQERVSSGSPTEPRTDPRKASKCSARARGRRSRVRNVPVCGGGGKIERIGNR
jgi:hypothetical protein